MMKNIKILNKDRLLLFVLGPAVSSKDVFIVLEDKDVQYTWTPTVQYTWTLTVRYNKDNISIWGKIQSCLLAAHYRIFLFPKIRVPQL